jgi:hypothetical protein
MQQVNHRNPQAGSKVYIESQKIQNNHIEVLEQI